MTAKKKTVAVILAAGEGLRFLGQNPPKQFRKIAGKTIFGQTIEKFEYNNNVDEIIVVVHKNYIEYSKKIIEESNFKKITTVIPGGKTRHESSRIGIFSCPKDTQKVLIHDAVRPFVNNTIINTLITTLDRYVAVDVAIPLADTVIQVNNKNIIKDIPPRKKLKRGQTPQGFIFSVIKKAHEKALRNGAEEFTDDCGLVLKYKLGKIFVVDGSEENIKITHPIDIHIADKLFQLRTTKIDDVRLPKNALLGKTVVIFGHTGGIGEAVFSLSKKMGATVFGFSRSTNVDVRRYSNIASALKTVEKTRQKIDILISTVGILKKETLEEQSVKDIRNQILTNFTSQVYIVKAAIPLMNTDSSIALFASSSYMRGRENYSIYSSTKAAIVNFVQAVSEENKDKNIKINAICPARTNTPLRRAHFGKEPLQSLLPPSRVARITLKACMSNLTGQVIDVRL